jgi:hypothetical protein
MNRIRPTVQVLARATCIYANKQTYIQTETDGIPYLISKSAYSTISQRRFFNHHGTFIWEFKEKSNRKFSVLPTGVHLSLTANLPASGRLAINSGVRWLGEVPDRYENSVNPGAHTASSRLDNCTKIRTGHLIARNVDCFRVPKQQLFLRNHIMELPASFRLFIWSRNSLLGNLKLNHLIRKTSQQDNVLLTSSSAHHTDVLYWLQDAMQQTVHD